MTLNRRELIIGGAALTAAASLGMPAIAFAAQSPEVEEAIKAFTGGADVQQGRVSLNTPEIAENGNTVPVEVSVESPMTSEDYVAEVMILAAGNPRPGVATFKFSDMSGEALASTRIRLAKTQDVIAVARMSDGTFYQDTKQVKVTIGGCGG